MHTSVASQFRYVTHEKSFHYKLEKRNLLNIAHVREADTQRDFLFALELCCVSVLFGTSPLSTLKTGDLQTGVGWEIRTSLAAFPLGSLILRVSGISFLPSSYTELGRVKRLLILF